MGWTNRQTGKTSNVAYKDNSNNYQKLSTTFLHKKLELFRH